MENSLFLAVSAEDEEAVAAFLSQGANPNQLTTGGKTSLGTACKIGNIQIINQLINATLGIETREKRRIEEENDRKTRLRNKCRLKRQDIISKNKLKNPVEPSLSDISQLSLLPLDLNCPKVNQGYYEFTYEGTSSDDNWLYMKTSPLSPVSIVLSPQGDLEWDEEILNVAPSTREDEVWSLIYNWYASMLEQTGAALESAANVICGINQEDTYSKTALHYAAENGHLETVRLLLESGSKINAETKDGNQPLHLAVKYNRLEVVQLLLDMGGQVNHPNYLKMTPLHFAAAGGYYKLARILITRGANVEARNNQERTPLFLAVLNGHEDTVHEFIVHKVKINVEDSNGNTPVCLAVRKNKPAILDILLRCGARLPYTRSLLHDAITAEQDDIVKILVNTGKGINLTDRFGDTPLIVAARLSQVHTVQYLLAHGANVNLCNRHGVSVLDVALDCEYDVFEELLESFLEYKINLNSVSLSGRTPLNEAIISNQEKNAILLIKHGLNVVNKDVYFIPAFLKNMASLGHLLLRAGHRYPDHNSFYQYTSQDIIITEEWQLILDSCKAPLLLKELCRISIRNTCKTRIIHSYIKKLPLPKSLKSYLMFDEY